MVLEFEKQPVASIEDWHDPLRRVNSLAKGFGGSAKKLSKIIGYPYSSMMAWKRKNPQAGSIVKLSYRLSANGLETDPFFLWERGEQLFAGVDYSDNWLRKVYDAISYALKAVPYDRLVSNIELLAMSEIDDFVSVPSTLKGSIKSGLRQYHAGKGMPRLPSFRRIMAAAEIGYALLVPTQYYSPSEIMGLYDVQSEQQANRAA